MTVSSKVWPLPKIEGKVNTPIKMQRTTNTGKGDFFTKTGGQGEKHLPTPPNIKKEWNEKNSQNLLNPQVDCCSSKKPTPRKSNLIKHQGRYEPLVFYMPDASVPARSVSGCCSLFKVNKTKGPLMYEGDASVQRVSTRQAFPVTKPAGIHNQNWRSWWRQRGTKPHGSVAQNEGCRSRRRTIPM